MPSFNEKATNTFFLTHRWISVLFERISKRMWLKTTCWLPFSLKEGMFHGDGAIERRSVSSMTIRLNVDETSAMEMLDFCVSNTIRF